MKVHVLTMLICFFSFYAIGQINNKITIGKKDTLDSRILNEQREIWVYHPDGVDGAKQAYPVIYLLDGSTHFHSLVGMIERMSATNLCPKMIVVGIINTNRVRDFLPKGDLSHPKVWKAAAEASGGIDNFLSFFEKELIPYINSQYLTMPYRMIVGHSFGAVAVMNALIHQPKLFNAYVSIDPQLWWDKQKLLKEIKTMAFDNAYKDKSFYLAIANSTNNNNVNTSSLLRDTSLKTEHTRLLLELKKILNEQKKKQLKFSGKFYQNDDHETIPFIAQYDALRFIFNFYRLKLLDDDYVKPKNNVFNKVQNHYRHLSKVFNYDIKPEEEYITRLGWTLFNRKLMKQALQFFKWNVSNYPKSAATHYYLGYYYEQNGEKEKAIDSYKKTILLDQLDNTLIQQRIDALQKN